MFNVNLNIAYCGFRFSGNYLMIKLLVFWMSGIHVMVKERCLYWIIQWWKHLCILKYCKWSAWKIYMTMILITCSWEGNICSFFLQPLLIIHSAWVYKPVCFTKKHLRLDIFRIKPNCNICVPVLVNTIIILPITHLLPDLDINLTLVIQPSVSWPWHHHFYSLHLAIYFLTLISILLLSTSLLVPDFNMKFVLFNQLPLTWSWHQYYLCQPATSIWLDYQSSVSWPWHQFDLSSSYLFPDLHINLTLVIQPSFTWCWHQFHSFYSTICFLTLTSILFLLILLIFYLVYQYMYSYMYIFHFNSLFFDFLIFVC